MKWFKRKNKIPMLSDWVGKRCTIDFDLPRSAWDTVMFGSPAHVIILAVEMPLIMIKSIHIGENVIWINANIIKTIKETNDH